jgi:hypothetical protein
MSHSTLFANPAERERERETPRYLVLPDVVEDSQLAILSETLSPKDILSGYILCYPKKLLKILERSRIFTYFQDTACFIYPGYSRTPPPFRDESDVHSARAPSVSVYNPT